MMSETTIPVRVAVRVRPLSLKETSNGCLSSVEVVPGRPQVVCKGGLEKAFTFDYAFGPEETQKGLYSACVDPLISQLFRGYNATVLAYGQTGSGKTFSMGTSPSEFAAEIDEGIIPRAVREIFSRMMEMQDYMFSVRIAFIELYKEQLYDLLSSKGKKKEECVVDIREDPKIGIVVANLTEVPVNDMESTMKQLEIGSQKRVTAATAMNSVSSRSHAIFTLMIEGNRRDISTIGEEDENQPSTLIAKFTLVDLAGSERAKKTQATGDRQKEGVAINLGLLALGQVISCLGGGGDLTKTHIPYRDSKLTRLLQDSLGGNSYTLMLACVSPADSNIDETVNTLRYADRARKIKNLPILNRDGKDREIANLKKELAQLRATLAKAGGPIENGNVNLMKTTSFGKELSEELESLKERYAAISRENSDLTMALVLIQEEMAFISEKVMMSDLAHEKMSSQLKNLQSRTEEILATTDSKEEIEIILRCIKEAVEVHRADEKQRIDHEVSRGSANVADSSDTSDVGFDEFNGKEASLALKHNELAQQLSLLNKNIAQKEHLASTIDAREEKMKTECEELKKAYEGEIESLTNELENLQQVMKSEPASKIAEQRRKQIQDLEHKIQELKLKIQNQERRLKNAEKSETLAKQLSNEIKSMKQQKVRLVKQMKEDGEQFRLWKQKKEHEVIKLKQNERKQQCEMAKMENFYNKKQNFLQRKMEEAVAANKRLKDILEKQKAARKQNANQGKPPGLAGCADRMRNVVMQELDMVVGVKEASQSREHLIEDRKTLTKHLNGLKNKSRLTMTAAEREIIAKKTARLEAELNDRNVQIAELQKQIESADSDKEKDGKNWWDSSVSTMTEAKLALQYLFEKAAENMVQSSAAQKELANLKPLYDEAVKNTSHLETEIDQMKKLHSEKLDKVCQDYEDRMQLLLANVANQETTEQQKLQKLEKEIAIMKEEFDLKPKKKINKTKSVMPMETNDDDGDEYLDELEGDEESENEKDDDDDDNDPEWKQTPLFRRIKKLRDENTARLLGKSKVEIPRKAYKRSVDSISENDENTSPDAKRFSISTSGCACKTGCKSNRCACKKIGQVCNDKCRCPNEICLNKDGASKSMTGRDSLCDITSAADNSDGTMSLLNATFDVSVPLLSRERN